MFRREGRFSLVLLVRVLVTFNTLLNLFFQWTLFSVRVFQHLWRHLYNVKLVHSLDSAYSSVETTLTECRAVAVSDNEYISQNSVTNGFVDGGGVC